jgi:hypothetical protein
MTTTIQSAATTLRAPEVEFEFDEAQLAAVSFLARYSGRTLEAYRHTCAASSNGPPTTASSCSGRIGRTSSVPRLDGGPLERDSVDRLAVQPLNEVVGRERPHPRGVPGEVGVVEEVTPVSPCWGRAVRTSSSFAPGWRTAG